MADNQGEMGISPRGGFEHRLNYCLQLKEKSVGEMPRENMIKKEKA